MSRQKNKVILPGWLGKHPFHPSEKRPVVITHKDEISTVYGEEGHQVSSQIYISTDQISLSDFIVPAGNYFYPPDIHGGDEVYYILDGNGIVINPDDKTAFNISKGDAFLIPKGCWHQVFNFQDAELKVACAIAPKIWTEKGINWVSRYNADGEKNHLSGAKRERDRLILLRPESWVSMIVGKEKCILKTIFTTTSFIQAGKIIVPAGRISEAEEHKGDEVLFLLKGKLMVKTYEKEGNSISQRSYEILDGEKFLIPADIKHQYLNFTGATVEILFATAIGT